MRFPTINYMEFAKTIPLDAAMVGASGMPAATLGDLGLADDGSIAMLHDGPYGSPALSEQIGARYGVPPTEVYPTEGTSLGNFLALAALFDQGGHAVVETPVYSPFLQQVEAVAEHVERLPREFENGFAIDPERLTALLRPDTRVVAVTNLHNPSGVRIPERTIIELAERAARVGAHLLIDEVYRDFLYDEPARTARTEAPNIIITSSLTKVYGLGNLRCGWLLGPPPLIHRASRINDYLGLLKPAPSISLGLRAFERLPQLKARSRRLLERSMPVLRKWLEGRDDLEVIWPAAGPVLFPRLTGRAAAVDTDRLAERLIDRHRVSIIPGRYFLAPNGIRIGATAPPEVLAEGLARLAEELDAALAGIG